MKPREQQKSMKTKMQAQRDAQKDKDFYTMLELKAERLVAALYMVSNFFEDTEPMKWKLRDMGLNVLSHVSRIKDKNASERSALLSRVSSDTLTIISLLEIARLSDFVSDMNYTILRREFGSFCALIRSRDEVAESVSDFRFSDDFFNLTEAGAAEWLPPSRKSGGGHTHAYRAPRSEARAAARRSRATVAYHPRESRRGSIEESSPSPAAKSVEEYVTSVSSSRPLPASDRSPQSVESVRKVEDGATVDSRQRSDTSAIGAREHSPSGTSPVVLEKKRYRRNVILDMLRTRGELSIKDISAAITDCSEKTIQRELLALVAEGVIEKRGERRWSRYSLPAS